MTSWQLALADDPTQEVYVLPYLARGYFDLGRYEAALQTVDRLIKIIAGHSSMVADVYSLGGDCYAKLGRDEDARRYYSSFLCEGLDRKLLGDKPAGRRITHANRYRLHPSIYPHVPSDGHGPWSWPAGSCSGYYVQQTYFSPKQRQYQLDFGDAQWIEPPEVAPIAYFRKEVFLSVPPEQAWLEVAATDNYDVIVNGHVRRKRIRSEDTGSRDL